jgi:hypothetical protein
MIRTIATILLILICASCRERLYIKNLTRPGGFAMGEEVQLMFETKATRTNPDSLPVFVLEIKTKYRYTAWALKGNCDKTCIYKVSWDGRKPDGSWPAGGRYLTYAIHDNGIYSDTVEFGLAD